MEQKLIVTEAKTGKATIRTIDDHIRDRIESSQRITGSLAKVDWKEINRRIAEGTNRRIQQELKSV